MSDHDQDTENERNVQALEARAAAHTAAKVAAAAAVAAEAEAKLAAEQREAAQRLVDQCLSLYRALDEAGKEAFRAAILK